MLAFMTKYERIDFYYMRICFWDTVTGVPLLARAPKASNLSKGDFFGSLPRILPLYSVFEQVSPPPKKINLPEQ